MELSKDAAAVARGRLRAFQAWSGPDRPGWALRREPLILRFMGPLGLLVLGATVICAALGLMLAVQADDHLDTAQRQALRAALDTLNSVASDVSRVEPSLIPVLARVSGLKDLRFDPDPPGGDRQVQSLLDRNGRIVGWFSWEGERPAIAIMLALMPLTALIVLGLLAFAGLALWQIKRLGSLLGGRERQLHKLTHEDPVTGLGNQVDLLELIDARIAGRREDTVVAFALLDFGGFDDMKDAIGAAEENGALVKIAHRLRDAMPRGTSVGRLDGDKFGLVIPAAGVEAAIAIAENARDVGSSAFQISANVGVAVAPRDGISRSELKERADMALRAARQRGRGLVVAFTPELAAECDERRFIKRELSTALAARAIEVHYQPIVRAEGGAIVGVEALLRWTHANRGPIPPSVFVRVAEEAGLMDRLGEFVLRRALTDAARWPGLYVAVNLSPIQMRDRKFVDLMAAVLGETRIKPSQIVLEITESVLVDDPQTAKARLEDLRALGVKLALDDFGSGYSSLAYLQQLPFDKLKVDRGFVAALEHSANAGVIIQAIVALGRALGLSVLVEGVETEEQRVLMRLAGCNEMQGFLFAKPSMREAIDRLVADGTSEIRCTG